MKRTTAFIALFIAIATAYFILSSTTGAGDSKETLLPSLARTFELIPADGYLIAADTLDKRIKLGKQDLIIVDARPNLADYEDGHIPGAIFIPWREIISEDALKKLPKDREIVLYDDNGSFQNQALLALRMLGYKAFALRWGMMSWTKTRSSAESIDAIQSGGRSSYPVAKGADSALKKERHKKVLEHAGC
jgi:rhodanese-related sulfurtransferase